MNEDTTPEDGMRAVVDSIGSPQPSATNHDPDLQPYLDRLHAMDPIDDVPGTASVPAGLRISRPTMEALPPQHRGDVRAKLERLSPEEQSKHEADLVYAKMREIVTRQRGRTGVGETALPYHKELATISGEVHQLNEQIDYFQNQIDRIRYENRFNSQTGKNEPIEVPVLSEVRRRAYANNILNLQRQKRLLMDENGELGIEGAKRAREAAVESAMHLRRIDEQRAEAAEIERRAKEMAREARINAQATARAKLLNSQVR